MEPADGPDEDATPLRLRIGVEFQHRLEWPVASVMQVEPRTDGLYRVLEEAMALPEGVTSRVYHDINGNRCRRLILPAGDSTVRYMAFLEVPSPPDPADPEAPQVSVDALPDDALLFTMPSRLIQSDLLSNTAWRLFGGTEPGWGRVQAVVDWVNANIEFAHNSSTSVTSAADVYVESRGVCRDLAQLSIAFCRALNIPARYAYGYLPDIDVEDPFDLPMDFYAWIEVYLGDRWWTFDPRNNARRRGRVVIGRGRDAVDVAMLTTFGSAPLTGFRVWAEVAGEGALLEDVNPVEQPA